MGKARRTLGAPLTDEEPVAAVWSDMVDIQGPSHFSEPPISSRFAMRIRGRGKVPWELRRLRIASSIGVAVILCLVPDTSVAGAENTKRVVVLYPASDGQPGIMLFDQGLRSTLKSSSAENIEIYNEYLDSARFADDGYQRRLAGFLREKYAGRKIDVVIPGLAPSLDFLLRFRAELFPEVPVVFGAIERREVKARQLGTDFTGIPMKVDLESTLETALHLHPGTQHVVIVAGKAKTDSYWVAEARKAFRGSEGKVDFVYLIGLPIDQLLHDVARLPKNSIVYYLNMFEDGRGETFVPAEVVDRLSAASNAPLYGHFRTFLGRGIVGGRVVDFKTEGVNAARLALRVLSGDEPKRIALPQQTSKNSYMFDWRQLRRWRIAESALPSGSIVLYKQPKLWDLYKWRIAGVVSASIVEALLIVGLLMERQNRKRADERFRQVVIAAPCGMVMTGSDGKIVLVNAKAEALFGYQHEELIGKSVELLMPGRFPDRHSAHRNGNFTSPASRTMDAGRELYGRRKDGSEFPMEVELNPIRADSRHLVLASVVDVTERKRAHEDLRESQRELRALTGKLLQAQDAERRRIARELHDDLNQGLALLAVQLDLLGQDTDESDLLLGGRLKELSDRVKQLSSSVHGLSTLLHPSKLEQLGLVAAVRGLCKELTQVHGLAIEFVDHPMPTSISDDAALCLYRIAQEALHNVIKHSGARRARVELGVEEGAVHLRIVDDGAGFDIDSLGAQGGLGLVGMRERLLLVGGAIAIDTRPSAGTRIDVHVPVPPPGEKPNDRLELTPRSPLAEI